MPASDRHDAGMAADKVSEAEIAELVQRTGQAASDFIRGDIRRYLEFIKHAHDFTLMPPTGGETRRGFDDSDESVEAIASFFHGGEAKLELIESYASGELVVLVAVERQHGEVGAFPDQDWSLRVTLVFRREGGEWWLVHRHADALVHPITMEQLSALARGQA